MSTTITVSSIIRDLLTDDNSLTGKQVIAEVTKIIPDAKPSTIQVTYSKTRKVLGIGKLERNMKSLGIAKTETSKTVKSSGVINTKQSTESSDINSDSMLALYRLMRKELTDNNEGFHSVLVLLHEDVGLGVDFLNRHILEK